MNSETNTNEKPLDTIVERDVLGQEKPAANPGAPKANPNRIFIGLAIIIIALAAYWFLKH